MSAKRYQMALEAILAVSTFDGSTMRRIAQVALDVAEPATVTMPAAPAAEAAAGEGQGVVVAQGVLGTSTHPLKVPVGLIDGAGQGEQLGADERCGRLLVGQGDDTADPFCWRPAGHSGACWPAAEDDGVGEGADRAGAAPVDEPDAAPQAATPPAAEVGAPPRAATAPAAPAGETVPFGGRNGADAPARRSGRAGSSPSPAGARATSGRPAEAKTVVTNEHVLAYVLEHKRVTVAEIASAFNASSASIGKHLQRLVAAGKIEAEGNTSSRIYLSKDAADHEVAQAAGRGSARRDGASVGQLRSRILVLLREDGGLREPEIAMRLNLHREHVAMATGDLLADRRVVLQGDGTYVAAESEAA